MRSISGMTVRRSHSRRRADIPQSEGSSRGPLLGRETELARLCDGLTDLRRGRGRTCLLRGEPGIGKTRLAQELVNHMLSQRAQERVAEELKIAPVNERSTVAPELAAMMDRLYALDMDHVNRVRPQWIERWNREVERK